MPLNVKKTKVLSFSSKTATSFFNYKLDRVSIELVNKVKDFAILFDPELSAIIVVS